MRLNKALLHPIVPICPYQVQQRKRGGTSLQECGHTPNKMRKQLLDPFYQLRASSAAIFLQLRCVRIASPYGWALIILL